MFLSYEYIKDLGYDEKTKQYRYQYKIIDTDFEEIAVGAAFEVWIAVGVVIDDAVDGAVAVIETYRKRNLIVVPNLIRCMQYNASLYSYPTIEKQIRLNRQHNPYWPEYEEEINKYLLLM